MNSKTPAQKAEQRIPDGFSEGLPKYVLPSDAICHTFNTGAVRSGDANNVRLDLVSPIALRQIAEFIDASQYYDNGTPAEIIGFALENTYSFLACEPHGSLELAAYRVLNAIQVERESARWYPISEIGYEIIPPLGIIAVAEACAEGAKKYNDFNWEKGMPAHDLLNHAIRHLLLWLTDDISEPHLAHAAWGYFAAIHSIVLWPELNSGHFRGPGCKPPHESLLPSANC